MIPALVRIAAAAVKAKSKVDKQIKSRYETEGYKRSENRKKLTRRIKRINKDIESGKISNPSEVEKAKGLVNFLEQLKSETYIDRKTGTYQYSFDRLRNTIDYATRKREEIISISQESEQVARTNRGQEMLQHRKNEIFQRELNAAGRDSDVSISRISKAEMKIFYASTMDIWKQVPDWKDRNLAIMQYYETKSLEEAFRKVMETDEAKEALKRAETEQEPEKGTSPDYITKLIAVLDR